MNNLFFKIKPNDPNLDILSTFLENPKERLESALGLLFSRYPKIKSFYFESDFEDPKLDCSFDFRITHINGVKLHCAQSSTEWAGKFYQESFLTEEEKSLLIELELKFEDFYFLLHALFVMRDHFGLENSDKLRVMIKHFLPETTQYSRWTGKEFPLGN